MIKILITGANGYIGKSLYNSLKTIYDVTTITRKDFDLRNSKQTLDYFSNKYFDVVIHCAVSGGSRLKTDTWQAADDNLKMYYNLLSCDNKFNTLINFGSGAEIYTPESPYGFSKRAITNSINEIPRFFNIRIYAVFDENELDTRFIKANLKRYINKEPLLIQNKRMTFFYMEDLITLVKHYINSPSTSLIKECNCSYINTYSMMEIAYIINSLADYTVPIYMNIDKSEDYESSYNAPYGINYIGLQNGILKTYNKLKYDTI
jgi:dTDP-4-dehydrorhamnose reductase